MAVSGAIRISLFDTSHTYMHYPMTKKKKLAELFRLEEESIPAFSVLVGHEIPAPPTMWLAALLVSTLHYLHQPFELQPEMWCTVCERTKLYCNHETCNRFMKIGAEQDVGGTSAANNTKTSDNKEKHNGDSVAGSKIRVRFLIDHF